MVPLLRFLVRRLLLAVLTLLVITAILYGIMMLAPPEARAMLYLPPGEQARSFNSLRTIIDRHGLDDPYPIQYMRWLTDLLRGDWGWSPTMNDDVLATLLRRTPVTAELTLYSVFFFIPLGLVSGVMAGWKHGRWVDHGFRLVAFLATSIPPFILALILLAVFYVSLHWFPPGRISVSNRLAITTDSFRTITGLLTIDGLLNGRLDITVDAARHLVLPVFSLSLTHWATLGRITRSAIIEELDQEYVLAARGRGLSMRRTVWRHVLHNALVPGLNSSALSAAALVTGVFVVEVIFSLPGVSEPLTRAVWSGNSFFAPDAATTMGFAVYSVLIVMPLMIILDILQTIVDPRIREEVLA